MGGNGAVPVRRLCLYVIKLGLFPAKIKRLKWPLSLMKWTYLFELDKVIKSTKVSEALHQNRPIIDFEFSERA